MHARSATLDDLPAIADLQHRWEIVWFGAVETDDDDIRKSLTRSDPLTERSRLLFDDWQLLAAAWFQGADTTVLVDPDRDAGPLYADLLPWLEERSVTGLEALSQDESLLTALTERSWRHARSSFELIRPVTPDWTIAEPHWPHGVTVRPLHADDAQAVHRLIYVDARWTDVPGHVDRGFADWREIFLDDVPAEQQVLAWRGSRLVGAAIGKVFSDGTGWVAQLGVASDERGRGLGTALLLEALRRRVSSGATSVGLSVQAENRAALDLYLRAGLVIDREWKEYTRRDR